MVSVSIFSFAYESVLVICFYFAFLFGIFLMYDFVLYLFDAREQELSSIFLMHVSKSLTKCPSSCVCVCVVDHMGQFNTQFIILPHK